MGVEASDAGVAGDRLPAEVANDDAELELTAGQRAAFFEYIRADRQCSIAEACRAAGIRRKVVRRLRREDAEFEEDYRTARGMGPGQVTDAMVKLAIEGVEEPLVSAGKLVVDEKTGEVVTVRKYSDRLLEALYKTVTPEGAPLLGPKASLEIHGEVRHTVQRGVDLAGVAKVLLDAGVPLHELAAGEEPVDDAAEIVAETDD